MTELPARIRDIMAAEALPLAADSGEALEIFSVPQLRGMVQRAHNLLGNGMGPVLVELGLGRAEIPELITAEALRTHPGFAEVMAGTRPLRVGEPDAELVRIAQHALQAVSVRVPGAPEEMRLATWGADGDFGGETRKAISAMRQWLGAGWTAAPASELGADEARLLAELLDVRPVPKLWAELPRAPLTEQASRRIVDIAVDICESTADVPYTRRVDGRIYRYTAKLFGVQVLADGLLTAPGGVAYGLRKGDHYWKCNIFAGAVLSLAEVPVPTFAVGPHRHYPRAERFGPRLAEKPGWKLIHYFDHRDPQNPEVAVPGEQQDAQIRRLLGDTRLGDLLFVDHPGEPGDNGGHTRICTAPVRPDDPDDAPMWAQGSSDRALERRDGMTMLGGGQETQFWLLRYQG